MKVVITGASGMLGGALLREVLARGAEVEGWSFSTPRSPDGLEFVPFDLGELLTMGERGLQNRVGTPELVVNCAALTDVDFCEDHPELAHRLNALVPECMAEYCAGLGTRFIQVSTDAVYDGEKSGRRREEESPGPTSVYASTKLEGEGRVLAANPEALVIRTTMLGWTLAGKRPKFAETILGALTTRQTIRLWSDAIFSPLHVVHLAEAILDLAGNPAADGIINVGSQDPISKIAFGKLIAEVFGLSAALIKETTIEEANLPAGRPKNVALDVSRTRILRGIPTPTVRDGIERLYQEAFDGTAEKIRGRTTYP